MVRDFPIIRLRESGVYERQNLLTSGLHVMPKDHYLRILDVFVDYDGSFVDNIRHGRRAVDDSMVPDFFVGAVESQPTFQINNSESFVMTLAVEPKPLVEITDGLTLFVVVNSTFDSTHDINLDYSLRGSLVSMATYLCALVDYYNVDLAGIMLKNYGELLGEQVVTDEG